MYAVLAFTACSQLAGLLEHDRQTLALAAAAALVGVGLWLAQGALYFAAFIFAGSLPVQACYALFGAAAGRFLSDQRVVRALNAASGVGIAVFGVYGLTCAF